MGSDTRVVLCNECEEWILQHGDFYFVGANIICLPCGHKWRKENPGRFMLLENGIKQDPVYIVKEAPPGFRYLDPEDGPKPLLNRCCSMLLIKHGPCIQPDVKEYLCPYCGAQWIVRRLPGTFGGVPQFEHKTTGDRFELIVGGQRNPTFLNPLPRSKALARAP